jgi:hypothetical protein
MGTLYDIVANLDALDQLTEDLGGDITDYADILDKWNAELGADLEHKVEAYIKVIREYEERSAARVREWRRIQESANAAATVAEHIKARLKDLLTLANIKRVKTNLGNVLIALNGGKLPLIVDLEPESLPKQFQRVSIDADKVAISTALEQGVHLDFARFGERGTHLMIR